MSSAATMRAAIADPDNLSKQVEKLLKQGQAIADAARSAGPGTPRGEVHVGALEQLAYAFSGMATLARD